MKDLKRKYLHNGVIYTLLQKNEFVAMYGIDGKKRNEMSSYKIGTIDVCWKDGYQIEYIPDNRHLRHYGDYERAVDYFTILTEEAIRLREQALLIAGFNKMPN